MTETKKIRSFRDLDVYERTYNASIAVIKKVVSKLPDTERFDLCDQLSRACKAIPRLIAEGYGKRHQRRGFQKYLDDAMGECNEMVVSLSQARDIYDSHVDIDLCNELIDTYDVSGRQLYCLEQSWSKFKEKKRPDS